MHKTSRYTKSMDVNFYQSWTALGFMYDNQQGIPDSQYTRVQHSRQKETFFCAYIKHLLNMGGFFSQTIECFDSLYINKRIIGSAYNVKSSMPNLIESVETCQLQEWDRILNFAQRAVFGDIIQILKSEPNEATGRLNENIIPEKKHSYRQNLALKFLQEVDTIGNHIVLIKSKNIIPALLYDNFELFTV